MATSIENESGELLWSPNNFGSYSVEKIQLIVDILKSLLQDTTLKLDTTSSLSGDYYTKEQTNETFLLKTDFNSLATSLVTSKLDEYIQQKETSGDLVDAETVRTCVKILNWVCKACFDQSYTDTSEITEMTEITPFPISIQNITSNLASMSTSVSHLQSVVYEVNSDGTVSSIVRVTTKSEFTALTDRIGSDTLTTSAKTITGAINELNSNVATGNRVTDLETKTDNLSNTVTSLNSSISTLNSTVSSLSTAVSNKVNTSNIVTKSTDSTNYVPAASLEYEDRDNIKSLQNSLNSLITRVTALEAKVNA